MGLDLYIEARILNRKTGRVISYGSEDDYSWVRDKGFFEVCWWCGSEFFDLRNKMIDVCNKYSRCAYSEEELVIPIPETALREVYFCILHGAFLADDMKFFSDGAEFAWEMRDLYESQNLLNAKKLHDLIRTLHEIEYNNEVAVDRNDYVSVMDWEAFMKSPRDFRWEFRIFNSF